MFYTSKAAGGESRPILSDNGREFCVRPDQRPCELFLQLDRVEHRTTKVRKPCLKGYIQRAAAEA